MTVDAATDPFFFFFGVEEKVNKSTREKRKTKSWKLLVIFQWGSEKNIFPTEYMRLFFFLLNMILTHIHNSESSQLTIFEGRSSAIYSAWATFWKPHHAKLCTILFPSLEVHWKCQRGCKLKVALRVIIQSGVVSGSTTWCTRNWGSHSKKTSYSANSSARRQANLVARASPLIGSTPLAFQRRALMMSTFQFRHTATALIQLSLREAS